MSLFAGPSALTVTIKNITNSSIVVQWDAVDDSLHTTYTVHWSDEEDDVATVEEQTSYTITGLILDTVYTIRVGAANMCGGGPEFRTRVVLSTDATSTTISPTNTASTTSMTITSTPNPSSASNPSTTTMTTNSITITVNENADISSSRNSDTSMTTTVTITDFSSNIATNMVVTSTNIANIPTTDETSKFSMHVCMVPLNYTV